MVKFRKITLPEITFGFWRRNSPLLAFLVVVLFSSGFGKKEIAGGDLAAQEALDKTVAYYQSAKSLSITFTANMYWSATEDWHESKGKLWTKGKDQYHLFLPDLEMVTDGKILWKYSKENNQVVISHVDSSIGAGHPSKILFEFLKCAPLSLKKIKSKKGTQLRLPLNTAGDFEQYDSLTVYLDAKTFVPRKIQTLDQAENRSDYTITKIKKNVKFKKKDFTYAIPKGVEVEDLRE